MPRDAVSRTANVERNGGHKWGNVKGKTLTLIYSMQNFFNLEKFFFTFKLITEKPVAKFYGNIRNDGQYKQENEDIARNEQFAKQYMLPV